MRFRSWMAAVIIMMAFAANGHGQGDTVTFFFKNDTVKTGSKLCVPLLVDNFDTIGGVQFSVYFDPFLLRFDSTSNFNPALTGTVDISTVNAIGGQIGYTLLAPGLTGTGIPDSTPLVELCFTVRGEPGRLCPLNYGPLNGAIEVIEPDFDFRPFELEKGFIHIQRPDTLTLHIRNCTSNEDSSGRFVVQATGGHPPYTIEYNNITGDTVSGSFILQNDDETGIIDELNIADYSIRVRDTSGATAADTLIIRNRGSLRYDVVTDNPQCSNTSDGSIEISNINGWWAPVIIKWPDGTLLESTMTDLGEGTYRARLIDRGGCTEDVEVELIPDGFDVDIDVTDESCFGNADGAFTIRGSGGSPYDSIFFDYVLGNDTIRDSILARTEITPGTYGFEVIDSTGCTFSDTISVAPGRKLSVLDLTTTDPSCNNVADGTVEIQVGYPNDTIQRGFIFTINPSPDVSVMDSIAFADSLLAGIYDVSVVDSNNAGCQIDTIFELSNPDAIQILLMDSGIESCQPGNDGFVEISVSGGSLSDSSTYDVTWSTGDSTTRIDNLDSGTFFVTVEDDNGCTLADTFQLINAASPVIAELISEKRSCMPDPDGSISFNLRLGNGDIDSLVFNGPMATEVLRNFGDTTLVFNGLDTGRYSISAVDINGCTAEGMIRIDAAQSIRILDVQRENVSCLSDTSGTIDISIAPGDAPLDRVILNDTLIFNESFIHVGAGTYDILVRDENGCSDTASVSIEDVVPLTIDSIISTDVSCAGFGDGSAGVFVSQGTGMNIEILWSNEETGMNIDSLRPGSYAVVVSDELACVDIASVDILEPEPIAATTFSTPDTSGTGVGSIEIDLSGGVGPYTLNWSHDPTADSTMLDSLMSGWYTFVVQDGNGCTYEDSVFVDNLTSSADISRISDFRLRPSVTSSVLIIDWSLNINTIGELIIYDMYGRVHFQTPLEREKRQLQMDISHWQNGIYAAELRTGKGRKTIKFIKY